MPHSDLNASDYRGVSHIPSEDDGLWAEFLAVNHMWVDKMCEPAMIYLHLLVEVLGAISIECELCWPNPWNLWVQ